MERHPNSAHHLIPDNTRIDLVNGSCLTAFEVVTEHASYALQGFIAGHDQESEWRVFVPISAVLHVTLNGEWNPLANMIL